MNTNALFEFFQTNTNLIEIKPRGYSDLRNIRDMVDEGLFVFLIKKNDEFYEEGDRKGERKEGHIAFIGHSNMLMYSGAGPTDYKDMKLDQIPNNEYHLTVVQGGLVPGVNSIHFTTANWTWGGEKRRKFLLDDYMRFYAVKR